MDQTQQHQSPVLAKPLTLTNVDGNLYQRDSSVEGQLSSSLIISDVEIVARAGITDKREDGYLQEEALVYLIRESKLEKKELLYYALSKILLTRCEDQVKYRLRSLDPDLKEDAYADVVQVLFDKILSPNGHGDFLQVRFWSALDRIAIDVFRQSYRRRSKDRNNLLPSSFSGTEETEKVEADWENAVPDTDSIIPSENLWSSVEGMVLIDDALEHLEEPIRTAFILNHYQDWQIESNDPCEITLSTYFKKTPRTIRNWLRKAVTILKVWRGEDHE